MTAAASGPAGRALHATRPTEVELFSIAGHDGHLREVNDAFARLLGLSAAEISGASLLELVHPDDIGPVVASLAGLESGVAEVLLETRFLQHDTGSWVHLQWVARPVTGTDLWWAAGRDTSKFHQLLAARSDLQARLELVIDQSSAAMWELDLTSGAFTWEPQAAAVFGVTVATLPTDADALAALVHPADAGALTVGLGKLPVTGRMEVELRVGAADQPRHLSLRGKVLDRDRRGRPQRAVGLVFDITTEKAMQDQLLRMVMTDALTGVPNRRSFDQTLRTEQRRCARAAEPWSVVMIDIDNFKQFNDTHGHLVGDDVLCGTARALSGSLNRAGDVLARFGGEEFAVVLPGTDSAGALTVANRLLQAIRGVHIRQAPGWPLTVSIGTATWTPDTPTMRARDVLQHADEALYAAKSAGKDRAVAYEQSLAARALFEQAISDGLRRGEFELYYQPILNLRTNAVTGFEALIRWNRPGHGLVPPDSFIPAAETATSDLICDLGRWVLTHATAQLAAWTASGLDPDGQWRMAVNISGRHVCNPAILTDVTYALETSGIEATRLELELTETAAVDDVLAGTHLGAVRALGVTVALDDFGTGHTSVGQLPKLAVDTLKIDRSFIASTDPRQRDLIQLMIGAARAFHLHVIAEGVEDAQTLQGLRNLGCDSAQGYLIARPMPADDVSQWLAGRHTR